MKGDTLQTLKKKVLSFSLVGALMTISTLAISVYFLKVQRTPLIPTYITVYGTSILISYLLNSYFTFKSKVKTGRLLIYFSIYLSAMCLGILLLSVYTRIFDFENWIYPFMVIPFTMSYNFILSNKYLTADAQQ